MPKGKQNEECAALAQIECFVFDMDGTINLGNVLIDGALELIELLREQKKPFYFFTNNSSKAPLDYVAKLTRLGFKGITREHIMTSGDVMIHYLKTLMAQPAVYLAGTPELEKQFRDAGITLLPGDVEQTDYVVLGFDTTFDFAKADNLCRLIAGGAKFLATNIDRVCPLEGDRFWPDCGSMCRMITHATGVEPEFVGKPFKHTVDFILDMTGTTRSKTAIVGDRLYTDIKTAVVGGIVGIAVLSGEVTYDDIMVDEVRPDYILDSVADIFRALQ
jgi:HAD superfamily hydrolase (TIGR01450 family)